MRASQTCPIRTNFRIASSTSWLLLGIICCTLLPGCASMTEKGKGKSKEDSKWSLFKKKEYQIPQSMNVTWVHDIISVPGKPPTRGFGGRIYFYNEKSQTIPVDGEVMVYGFDDTLVSHEGVGMDQADKRFRFTPEQFTTHFSEGDLGASYSIWVPWDAAPGAKKKIMLIPTFKSKDGKVIRGNAATLLLPGWSEEEASGKVIQAGASPSGGNPSGVQLASATSQPNSNGVMEDRPKTTTIQMPVRAAARVQPLLTPEQASQLLEQARSANFDPATLQQFGIQPAGTPAMPGVAIPSNTMPNGTSMNQPSTNQGYNSTNNNGTVSATATSMRDVSIQNAMNSGSTPLFHVPTTSLSPSLLPGMPNQLSVMPNSGLQGHSPTGLASQPLSAHSAQNPLQAPTSSNAPSAAYPLR